jgi:hypothetical protein
MPTARTLWLILLTAALGACAGGGASANLAGTEGDAASASLSLNTPYAIKVKLMTARCLTPLSGGQANGTKLVLSDCNGSAAQSWVQTGDHDDLVVFGTKCLDVAGGSTANGTQLQLWDCATNNDNQRWAFVGEQLVWVGHNKCLDITNGDFASNTTVLQIWDCDTSNTSQQWQFVAVKAATTPTTTSPASTTAGGGQVPSSAMPPLDMSQVRTRFSGDWGTVPVQQDASQCLSVVSFPDDLRLTTSACQGAIGQTFGFDPNGRILFPSQTTAAGSTTYRRGEYCLGLGTDGQAPQFLPCNSGDADQAWGSVQNALVMLRSRMCLGRTAAGANASTVQMVPCTQRPETMWLLPG